MLEIPGEEAPTDPGIQARQRQVQEERQRSAAQQKKNRLVGVVALLAVLGVGGAGVAYYQSEQASLTYEMDDFYVTPLEDLAAAVEPPAPVEGSDPAPVAAVKSNGSRRSGVGANAVAMADRPRTPESGLKSASDGGSTADAVPGGISTSLPSAETVGVGVGGMKIGYVQSDVVLTDDKEIYDMAKRVINGSSPQLQACYNQRLKQVEGLKGAWEVSFTIGKDGGTKSVRVKGVNGADPDLEGCMSRSVGAWKFQKISKDQAIKKTYRFGAGSW